MPSSFFRPRTDLQTGDRPSQTPPFLFSLFPFLRIRPQEKSGVFPPPLLRSFAWAAPRPHTCLDFFSSLFIASKVPPTFTRRCCHSRRGGPLSHASGGCLMTYQAQKKKVECVPNRAGGWLLKVEHMTGKDPEEEEEERLRFLECQSTPSW